MAWAQNLLGFCFFACASQTPFSWVWPGGLQAFSLFLVGSKSNVSAVFWLRFRMVWALYFFLFNGFQNRSFGIFPAAVSQWLGHKTCWGSAFSHARPKHLFLEFGLVACRLPSLTLRKGLPCLRQPFFFVFSRFQKQRFGSFLGGVSHGTYQTTSLDDCMENSCQGEKLESGEKSDRNGEPFYTTTLQMHYNALTLTSNSMTEQEYWFFDSDSSSNQSVQSRRCVWILLVMLASASSLHIQLLSSDSSVYFKSYIPTHHQDLHIHNQRAKQKQTTWNTTHPRWLQETKPTSKPHEILRKTQIGACSTEGKKKQSGSCMLRSSKSDSTCCTVVHLNSAKICFDTSCCLFC